MRFEKISKQQFEKDFNESNSNITYDEIKLPVRATKCSAGYDIFSTRTIHLRPGDSVKIPTGLRVLLDDDKFLMVVPRSGLGFKFRIQLDNTVGIIDADYSNSDNEGHMWIKITNDSKHNDSMTIEAGQAIAQGIIMSYFKVDDDCADGIRNGGFGSTSK